MVYHRTLGEKIFDAFNVLFMIILFLIMVYPFLYVVNYSISIPTGLNGKLLLLPQGLDLSAYKTLLLDDGILRALLVSVARSAIGTVLMLVITGMAAYALAVPNLICGKLLRITFVLTMYLSAGTIPTYIFMQKYHLLNSFWVYILPNLCYAFNLVLMKNYMESIPETLREAVYIDGGNDLQAYWLVIFPICKPVNAAVFLFGVLKQWNNFMDTQLYCSMKEELYTLQYVLYNTLASQTNIEALMSGGAQVTSGQSIKMAITVITVLPVLCVYPSLAKHFTSGLMLGSVKG